MCLLLIFFVGVAAYILFDWLIHLPKVRSFDQKYIVITGCDSEFGKLLALRLEELGFRIFAGCLTERGKALMSETCSSNLTPVLLDVTDDNSVQDFTKAVKRNLPENSGIWALVNTAGTLGDNLRADQLTREDFRKVVGVNLLGQVEMTRAFLPLVRESQGRVVNMSSVNGRLGFRYAPYTASKFGVEAFSDVLRHEVYRQGIKVSIIEQFVFKADLINVDKSRQQQVRESVKKSKQETEHPHYGPAFLNETKRTQVNRVVEAYTHAVTARVPRTRYVVGWDAFFLCNVVATLPDWAADYVVRKCFDCKITEADRKAVK